MGEASEAPLAAAAAAAEEEQKEVASPLAGGPVRKVSKDPLGPGAAPQEGAVASPWAGRPGEEASEAPLGPAAAPEEEEVASALTAEPLREDSTDLLSPAAAVETGAVASPLVPGHQMEKKLQDMKTLPHRGVRQAERMQLPAVPPLPRQAATLKQVPAAQASSSERATCKLPPLQAAASASSRGGRAKASGTEARSQQELLPPLPCISGDRDRAVRAERQERGPHSPVAVVDSQGRARHACSVSDEELDERVDTIVAAVLLQAVAIIQGAPSKAAVCSLGHSAQAASSHTRGCRMYILAFCLGRRPCGGGQ